MFLVNAVDIIVVCLVLLSVFLVVFLRFILPRIKTSKVKNKECSNACKCKRD